MKNFAMIGVGGYIAPRHMQAISATGHRLVAALDRHDSVGILDRHFEDVRFFTEFERFDRHVTKLQRAAREEHIDYVTICSPNYLHDAHIRFALRVGAAAICEKPLVINPWNLDHLMQLESETGGRVCTILQLRKHPAILALKERMESAAGGAKPEIELTYITSRGPWYFTSWKGSPEKSGGVATNIGIHFFDMLLWIFGARQAHEVHLDEPQRMAGYLELERARVRWFLSVAREDMPAEVRAAGQRTHRAILVNGEQVEFSEGFTDLHTEVYADILAGGGFGIEDARPSIELVHEIRTSAAVAPGERAHPILRF